MFRNEQGERRWPVLILPLLLCASPVVAILLNQSLPGWGFLSYELRNVLFLLTIPFVLGVVSETRPLLIGELEARDGTFVFAAILLIGWFVLVLQGWAFGLWVNLLPLAFFVSQVGAFHAGRWVGRVPRPNLPDEPGDG
ncbi:hypothetical protein [Rhodoblastus sp.]|uniref:hypothetical protein n=1 Tax=Rhodoblastus sp. TaxID=1962975 RepID=UPI0035AD7AE3